MESSPPTLVDVDQYQIGQSRDSVLDRLGAPESTASESDGASCDFYRLALERNVAVAQGAPDAATWLADHLQNETHLVTFCYKDGRIVHINTNAGPRAGSGQTALGAASAVPITPTSATATLKTPIAASGLASEPSAVGALSGTTPSAGAAPLTHVSPGRSSGQSPSTSPPVATP
jgi:hypothetical protein